MKEWWEVVVVVVMVSIVTRKTSGMKLEEGASEQAAQAAKPETNSPTVSQTGLAPPHSTFRIPNVPKNSMPTQFAIRNDAFITCSEMGWYPFPHECRHFYHCPDKADQQFIKTYYTYSCFKGNVFNPLTVECEPGMCWGGGGHQYPIFGEGNVVLDPGMGGPPGIPSENNTEGSLPPPPPPGSALTGTSTVDSSQVPPWFNNKPKWFDETPWWLKTPPNWFNKPPAYFKAPPASHVSTVPKEIDIEVGGEAEEGTADQVTKTINLGTNTSVMGEDNTVYHDDKTLRIHIPIKIIQQ